MKKFEGGLRKFSKIQGKIILVKYFHKLPPIFPETLKIFR